MILHWKILRSGFCLPVALAVLLSVMLASIPATSKAGISEQEAQAIGVDAYLYFYPIITMDVTVNNPPTSSLAKQFSGGR